MLQDGTTWFALAVGLVLIVAALAMFRQPPKLP